MKVKKSIAVYAAKWAVTTAVVWYLKNKITDKISRSPKKTTIEVG